MQVFLDEMSENGLKPHPTTDELTVLSRDELFLIKQQSERTRLETKQALNDARAKFARGEGGTPRWKLDTWQRIIMWHGQLGQLIQTALGKKKRHDHHDRAQLFIDAARQLLSAEQFDAIWAEVGRGKDDG